MRCNDFECSNQFNEFLNICCLRFIMENFADGVTATKWAIAGQFEIEALGLLYSVAVSTKIDFDRRRHRHLEEEEYHRALASSGLEGSDWDVGFSLSCVGICKAIAEFFEDVGEAIWSGMQSIATFFAEDVVGKQTFNFRHMLVFSFCLDIGILLTFAYSRAHPSSLSKLVTIPWNYLLLLPHRVLQRCSRSCW